MTDKHHSNISRRYTEYTIRISASYEIFILYVGPHKLMLNAIAWLPTTQLYSQALSLGSKSIWMKELIYNCNLTAVSECTKEEWRHPELIPKQTVREGGGNHVKPQIMLCKAQPHNYSRTCQKQTVSHDMQVWSGSSAPRGRKSLVACDLSI